MGLQVLTPKCMHGLAAETGRQGVASAGICVQAICHCLPTGTGWHCPSSAVRTHIWFWSKQLPCSEGMLSDQNVHSTCNRPCLKVWMPGQQTCKLRTPGSVAGCRNTTAPSCEQPSSSCAMMRHPWSGEQHHRCRLLTRLHVPASLLVLLLSWFAHLPLMLHYRYYHYYHTGCGEQWVLVARGGCSCCMNAIFRSTTSFSHLINLMLCLPVITVWCHHAPCPG